MSFALRNFPCRCSQGDRRHSILLEHAVAFSPRASTLQEPALWLKPLFKKSQHGSGRTTAYRRQRNGTPFQKSSCDMQHLRTLLADWASTWPIISKRERPVRASAVRTTARGSRPAAFDGGISFPRDRSSSAQLRSSRQTCTTMRRPGSPERVRIVTAPVPLSPHERNPDNLYTKRANERTHPGERGSERYQRLEVEGGGLALPVRNRVTARDR